MCVCVRAPLNCETTATRSGQTALLHPQREFSLISCACSMKDMVHVWVSNPFLKSMCLNARRVHLIMPNGLQLSHNPPNVPRSPETFGSVLSRASMTMFWLIYGYTLCEQWLFGCMSALGADHTRSPLIKCQPWQEVCCWRWPPSCPTSVFFLFYYLNSISFTTIARNRTIFLQRNRYAGINETVPLYVSTIHIMHCHVPWEIKYVLKSHLCHAPEGAHRTNSWHRVWQSHPGI